MSKSEFERREALIHTERPTPASVYTRRLAERKLELADLRMLHRRLWACLIATALAAAVIAYGALALHLISTLWILLPSMGFLSVIQSLARNSRSHNGLQRVLKFYELGIARLTNQWQGQGISGAEFQPDSHPYASDLDLFGPGSLFELLCTARTGVGRTMLADWLLTPAECGEATERQQAVAELRDMVDFREDWASVEGDALDQSGSSIRDWAGVPIAAFPFYARALAVVLPICLIALSIVAGVGLFGHRWPWAIGVPIGLEAFLAVLFLKQTRRTAAEITLPSFELTLLVPLLEHIEKTHFQCRLLKSLRSCLTGSSGQASKQIRLLRFWVWLLDLRQIEYFALLSAPILWGTNLAILIERWRGRNQRGLAGWLDSLGRFEALLCLARYYYENPDHSFAILKPQSAPLFRAEALGHPLLERRTCVRCDLGLDAQGTQLIMVSGSNMSGKSTLLRSVGVNSVLAFAGAPVRAARLEISPLRIGCSIAIQDSLVRAESRFQAEVERLKWILVLSRTNNVLFLLDEVLGGTNSNDRFWGARAVVKQLARSGAIGLVTTHDLALTQIVSALDGPAINVHFEEHYENGEMRFDYRMRPGVLTRTNGMNVMAALGLLPFSETEESPP